MKQIKKQKYQHEKIQERYEKDVVLPNLAREENHKSNLKKLHRPIRKEELDDHERAYQEVKRNKDK